MSKKYTIDIIKEKTKNLDRRYVCISKNYENSWTKLIFKCKEEHIFKMSWNSFQQGHRCPECMGNKKHTIKYIKEKTKKLTDEYECLSNIYEKNDAKLLFRCDVGHKFWMGWSSFRIGQRCPECAGNKKYTIEEIKEIVKKESYICLSNEYINASSKLKFKCNRDHIFKMQWNHFKSGHRCRKCHIENNKGKNHYSWKGGKNVTWYNTYAPQISWCEEVRRDPENPDYLQVRCTESSCREWFKPTCKQVCERMRAINGKSKGEARFYCSEECKSNCSIYRQHKYPKDQKPYHSRPDQAEWRKLVLERDDYTCQRCGKKKDLKDLSELVAHHIESLVQNPIMSADIDIGITFCTECDKIIHSEIGCRLIDLTRKNLC